MENEIKKKNGYKLMIKDYLEEVNSFSLKKIGELDLIDLRQTDEIMNKFSKVPDFPFYQVKLFFEEKTSEKFSNFLRILYNANPSNVYLWTELVEHCGVCVLDSILDINTRFSFECSNNGLFTITTLDMRDRILFDFYEKSEIRLLDVELFGTNWSKMRWEI
jgi:hypothetical protein